MKRFLIGPLWIHRNEQYDLPCYPIICVHWMRPNRSTRVLCVWRWGLQIRPLMITRNMLSIGSRIIWRWKRG
jgi:hypothetical protein